MYTFLSFVGVIVALTVLGTIPFIVDRNAPTIAHPHTEAEPERASTSTSLPASDSSAPKRTSREQKAHGEHPAHESATATTAESRAERSEETVSA